MVYKPLQGPANGVYWYALQTYAAAEVAFRRWVSLVDGSGLLSKTNESKLYGRLINGATVFFKSGNNFEDLRGDTLHGGIIDEVRQQHPDLWTKIIRPMLSRHKGWCDLYSTPNGFDHFYDLAEEARVDTSGEWGLFKAPSTEAWWWTPAEIASAKRTMTEAEFAQEILAEFRDMTSGRAYSNYSEANERTQNPFAPPGARYSRNLPIVVALDFNITPMAWTLGQRKGFDSHWVEEIWVEGTHTQACAKELVSRIHASGTDYGNVGVVLAGDATGKATQRSSNKSDYDIICQALNDAGIRWDNATPEANPGIRDRVNTVNARLCSAVGVRHLTLNPNDCPMLKRDFQRQCWKVGLTTSAQLDSGTKKDLGHAADGIGYAEHALAPIELSGAVGKLLVVMR